MLIRAEWSERACFWRGRYPSQPAIIGYEVCWCMRGGTFASGLGRNLMAMTVVFFVELSDTCD